MYHSERKRRTNRKGLAMSQWGFQRMTRKRLFEWMKENFHIIPLRTSIMWLFGGENVTLVRGSFGIGVQTKWYDVHQSYDYVPVTKNRRSFHHKPRWQKKAEQAFYDLWVASYKKVLEGIDDLTERYAINGFTHPFSPYIMGMDFGPSIIEPRAFIKHDYTDPDYKLTGTQTGRTSSNEPNLSNDSH